MVGSLTDSLESILRLQSELERAMDFDFFGSATCSRCGFPAINVFKDKNSNLLLKAEIPGIRKEDLSVELKDGQIRIFGERTSDFSKNEVSVHRLERSFEKFDRTFKIPFKVDEKKVMAKVENGILTISLPQSEQDKPHKVAIS